jgi:hypothetical protein
MSVGVGDCRVVASHAAALAGSTRRKPGDLDSGDPKIVRFGPVAHFSIPNWPTTCVEILWRMLA